MAELSPFYDFDILYSKAILSTKYLEKDKVGSWYQAYILGTWRRWPDKLFLKYCEYLTELFPFFT